MTMIWFYRNELRDVVAPSRTLRLEAGRGGSPERFWLGNGSLAVCLDPSQAAVFLTALAKMAACVQQGRLLDRSFYSRDIYDDTGACLGVDLGILTGRPYIGLDDFRIDISADDLTYLAAACRQAHYLAEGIGPASRLAGYGQRSRPTQLRPDPEFAFERSGYERW